MSCGNAAARVLAAVLGLLCASSSFGQSSASKPGGGNVTIRVVVDGLVCSGAPGVFEAAAFQLAASDSIASSNGGPPIGKITFSDLQLSKPPDNCSLPLLQLASSGKVIKRVVVTKTDKSGRPVLMISLDNAIVALAQAAGSESEDAVEQVSFFYDTVTITDAAGNTTGSIHR